MEIISAEKIGYETALKEIMSLRKGTIIFVECYETELDKKYYAGQDKAYQYAMEKGYIESVSINFDLYGNITNMTFKRL